MRHLKLFRGILAVAATLIAPCDSSWSQSNDDGRQMTRAEKIRYIFRTFPVRRDYPLREKNISDTEVREIEAVMKERFPGSIVHISGVVVGCPCEDGPKCSAQVWSVATRDAISDQVVLSRIDGRWAVGPLQAWWIVRERIVSEFRKPVKKEPEDRRIDFREYRRRLNEHIDAFPFCAE